MQPMTWTPNRDRPCRRSGAVSRSSTTETTRFPTSALSVLKDTPQGTRCTFYDPLQVSHPNWWTPWDLDPATSVKSRARALDLVAERAVLVHAYHMPFPGLGWIERVGTGFRWLPSSGRHYREDAVRSLDYDPIDVLQGRSLDPHGRLRKDLD